jgi:isocitrate dehydrogenase
MFFSSFIFTRLRRASPSSFRPATVTYNFARLMDGAKEACPPFVWRIKCSQFGDAVIKHM